MVDIKPIKSEAEYDTALSESERYFDNEPVTGTPEAGRFDLLALVIGDYEDKHWRMDLPDPVTAIEFAIKQRGVTRLQLKSSPAPVFDTHLSLQATSDQQHDTT